MHLWELRSSLEYEKVKMFRTVVEGFIKARTGTRNWLHGSRSTKIEAELGYTIYPIYHCSSARWLNLDKISALSKRV